jgi:LCP family protein required for cell wall assembly
MASTPQSSPRSRTFVTRYLVALGVTFVTLLTGVVAVNVAVNQKLAGIGRVNGLDLPDSPGKAGNYLVLGSDSRAFVQNDQQAQAFGTTGDAGGNRSDTLMIVHIDPETKQSLLVSIPRDTLVDIPGRGKQKINGAYNDGPQKVIDTIEQNFNVPINHYVELNFEAFIGVVNAIGTVPVYFPAPARDAFSGLNIQTAPACVNLNGDGALAYVRSRHLEYYDSTTKRWSNADAIPDIGRIGRQQSFIRRLAQVAAQKAGRNPFTANRMANAVVPKLTVDQGLGRSDIFALVNTFRTVNPTDTSSIEMVTLPTKGGPYYNGQSVLYLDQPSAEATLARLRTFGPADGSTQSTTPIKVSPSQVRVRVLNGSSTSGLAGQTLTELQRYSFQPAGFGNAARVSATQIRYRSGHLDDGRLVQQYLGGIGTLIEDKSLIDADVAIVVGPDFGSVRAPGATGSDGAKPTTTTTKRPAGGTTPSAPATPAC